MLIVNGIMVNFNKNWIYVQQTHCVTSPRPDFLPFPVDHNIFTQMSDPFYSEGVYSLTFWLITYDPQRIIRKQLYQNIAWWVRHKHIQFLFKLAMIPLTKGMFRQCRCFRIQVFGSAQFRHFWKQKFDLDSENYMVGMTGISDFIIYIIFSFWSYT